MPHGSVKVKNVPSLFLLDSSPQTPQNLRDKTSHPSSYRRRSNFQPIASAPRFGLLIAIIICILLLPYVVHRVFRASRTQRDRLPIVGDLYQDYFKHYEGHQECGMQSTELYVPPAVTGKPSAKDLSFCKNRATLMQAMSGGGRHGFDAPFTPKGCHYRWYNTEEICMILDRFDGVAFIGDEMVRQIYVAFNILLRENIALGGLEQWRMTDDERNTCKCENQLLKPACQSFSVTASQDVASNDAIGGHSSPYWCNRTPHFLIPVTDSPVNDARHKQLSELLGKDPGSYKPMPIILGLGLGTSFSWDIATRSMDEWLSIADASLRNTPFLWIGPNAAGYLKPPGKILKEGNNALWHYTVELGKEARNRGMETLGMYNMTIQASSWDGSNYGLRVNLVQAMMIINWLSRVEST